MITMICRDDGTKEMNLLPNAIRALIQLKKDRKVARDLCERYSIENMALADEIRFKQMEARKELVHQIGYAIKMNIHPADEIAEMLGF